MIASKIEGFVNSELGFWVEMLIKCGRRKIHFKRLELLYRRWKSASLYCLIKRGKNNENHIDSTKR